MLRTSTSILGMALLSSAALALGSSCSSGDASPVDNAGGDLGNHVGDGGAGGSGKAGTSRGGSNAGGGSGGGNVSSSKGGNGGRSNAAGGAGVGTSSRGGSNTNAGGSKGTGGSKVNNTSPGAGGAAGAPTSTPAPSDGTCSNPMSGDVKMSVPSGAFQGTLSVMLSTEVSGAEIRYTTDGQAPTATSNLYSGAISISKTTRLRAAAFVGADISGTPSAALYVARSIDAKHDLPVIILDSYGSGKLPTAEAQRQFVDVAYLAYDRTEGDVSLSSSPTVASFAAFHVRGNSSAMFDKVPYRLELRDDAGNDRDCPVLGMPAESDWALVGPHADKTLIHNNFVYDLGRELGMQVPRVKLAEVYVNVDNQPLAADDYQGVYQIVETIKDQKNRLNLKQLDETEISDTQISGGYIFKFEWMITAENPLECPTSAANCWKAMELVDPIPAAPEQKNWLTQHLVSFNDAVHSSNAADEANGYPKYIEAKTFIDTIIISEFTRNMDAYVRSQYFYKDRDAKINAGPLWDFDLIAGVGMSTMGGMPGGGFPGGGFPGMPGTGVDSGAAAPATSMANIPIEGWQYEGNGSRMANQTSDWFPVLLANATFKSQLVTRWKELRKGPLADSAVAARIDAVSAGLANAADRNFKKWNILTQARVNPFDTPTDATWAGQITQMKTWLQKRAAWLDGQWK